MDDLSLNNVRPLDRPMTAGRNDRFIALDELCQKVYETPTGKRYTIRPATAEESKTTRAKVEDWVDEGAPLPSWEQIAETMKAMPGAIYDSAQRSLSGDASLGELMGFAGASGAPGVASRVGTTLDSSVVSAMGATHKVPRYKKKPLVLENPVVKGAAKPEQLETFNDEGFLNLENPNPDANFGTTRLGDVFSEDRDFAPAGGTWAYAPNISMHDMARLRLGQINLPDLLNYYGMDPEPELLDYVSTGMTRLSENTEFQNYIAALQQNPNFDPWPNDNPFDTADKFFGFDKPAIQFRDPLDEILLEMEIPPKGITGAQLLKELQDNPTVRMAQLRSQGVLDRIDPAKRYDDPKARRNSREVDDLLIEGKYNVQAVPQNKYDSHQRQPVADKELNYVEYAVNAERDGPTFKANSQHYQDSTLAHVRLSERENPAGNYVLIEELQSDLLQQGYRKPSKNPFANALQELETRWSQDYPNEGVDTKVIQAFTPEDLQEYRGLDAVVGLTVGGPDSGKKALQNLENFVEALSYDPRFKGAYPHILKDWLYRLDFYERQALPETSLPPIAKMEDSVRLGLETAIAHAAQNNIERVVIPPFHRIVEQRFTKGSKDYDKAMDPKSGFYQTYVGAVNKVLKKLNEDMGVDVEVKEFVLPYNDVLGREATDLLSELGNREFATLRTSLEKIGLEKRLLEELSPTQTQVLTAFERKVQEIAPDFTVLGWADRLFEGDRYDGLSDSLQSFFISQNAGLDPGLEINFSNAIKNGYDLTHPRFAKGGVVENQTPVPPGATPKEVADDVPIMASDGEYILPANVVRFIGLDKIEKMFDQAKIKLAELDQKGRIGGDTGNDEELPFNPEELQRVPAEDNAAGVIPQMAEGGLIGNNQNPNMQIDPATGLPLWLLQMQGQSQAPVTAPTVTSPPIAPPMASTGPSMKRESDRDRGFEVNLTGTAQSVAKWSPEEFNKYARTRGNTGQALGSAAVSMIPGANIGARMRGNYLERAVPRGFDTMLETGRDLQGNPLTANQVTELRTSYDRVQNTTKPRTGAIGALRGLAEDTGLVRRREPTAEREPRSLRDTFSSGSSSRPKASGDGLVSRPDKKKQSGGQKTSTSSTNGKTSSKKK